MFGYILPLNIVLIWYIQIYSRLILSADLTSFEQNDYVVKYHHVHVEFSDPKFVESFELKNVKPNRTYKAFSASFHLLTDIEDNHRFKSNLKAFRLHSNSLDHLLFQFNIDVCHLLRKNTFGMEHVLGTGNITMCPIKKGYYYAKNFIMDDKRMPPYIPEGTYKILITLMKDKITLTITSLYMDVIYKVKH